MAIPIKGPEKIKEVEETQRATEKYIARTLSQYLDNLKVFIKVVGDEKSKKGFTANQLAKKTTYNANEIQALLKAMMTYGLVKLVNVNKRTEWAIVTDDAEQMEIIEAFESSLDEEITQLVKQKKQSEAIKKVIKQYQEYEEPEAGDREETRKVQEPTSGREGTEQSTEDKGTV